MNAPRVCRYGFEAVYVDLDIHDAPDRAARTLASARALRNRFPEADVIVGGGVLVVVGNVREDDIAKALQQATTDSGPGFTPTNHVLPIVFDGPDLEDVSNTTNLPPDEIIKSLVNTDFMVEFVGFLPGFGYLGPLDPRLVLPRRKTPRPRVPAGSFGIAGGFAGIYPFASPGGWNLLGRSVGQALFDPDRDKPFLFAPEDRVRFEAVATADVPSVEPLPKNATRPLADKPAFVVEAAPACATIQDVGRPGRLHCGMPRSGPLDPDTFFAANLAVGNEPGEAALEIPLGRFAFRALRDLVISVDGEKFIRLADGERFEVPENWRAVRYLALRGGVDVPLVLESRSTLLVARVGGFSGRPLRKGDIVGLADRAVGEMPEAPMLDEEPSGVVDIVIDPGPHLDRFPAHALDVLLSSTYSISTLGDRVGVRLDGQKIPRIGGDSALPVPMLRGAMQIATDGTPIVFGPDHPATGGYPVLAIVTGSSWGSLARLRPGRQLRFVVSA